MHWMQEEERALDLKSWGVVAKRDLECGDIVTVVPEHDKQIVRSRAETSKKLPQALSPGGGIGQLVNHSCCATHRNASSITMALAGDPRVDDRHNDGKVVLPSTSKLIMSRCRFIVIRQDRELGHGRNLTCRFCSAMGS
jgi:hypothetical protein